MSFVFLGWKSEKTRNGRSDHRGAGIVDYYVEELASGREGPPFPPGIFWMQSRLTKEDWAKLANDPNPPTPLKTPLAVTYIPEVISEDGIRRYLDEIGLIVGTRIDRQ